MTIYYFSFFDIIEHMRTILIISLLISYQITRSQSIKDNFTNHHIEYPPEDLDDIYTPTSKINEYTHRFFQSPLFSFPNETTGPLRYQGGKKAEFHYIVDPASYSSIVLNFSSISKGFYGKVSVIDGLLNHLTYPITFRPTQLSYDIPLTLEYTSQNPDLNPSLINVVTIQFNSGDIENVQLDLDSVEIVPEPVSLLTIATGSMAFIRKRRKKIYCG